MKISIITPLYNVENTLWDSLTSIQSHEWREIELVLVNDGSTDQTQGILEKYAAECPFSCRVIRQENQGAAAARNRGLQCASGEYLVFLDADDRFAPDALDRILALTATGEDIFGWDFVAEAARSRRSIRQADYATPEEALKNLMGGTMKWNLWLFAVKRELAVNNGLQFVPGDDMGEDMAFMLKAFACAKTVRQVHEPLYRYNAANPSSISAQMNERRRAQVTRNLSSAVAFLAQTSRAGLCESYLSSLKLYIKRPLLISTSFKDYREWYGWFPESNSFAMANGALPFRIRLLQGMASHRMWLFVWLYNIVIYKIIYRLIH